MGIHDFTLELQDLPQFADNPVTKQEIKDFIQNLLQKNKISNEEIVSIDFAYDLSSSYSLISLVSDQKIKQKYLLEQLLENKNNNNDDGNKLQEELEKLNKNLQINLDQLKNNISIDDRNINDNNMFKELTETVFITFKKSHIPKILQQILNDV